VWNKQNVKKTLEERPPTSNKKKNISCISAVTQVCELSKRIEVTLNNASDYRANELIHY